MPRKTSHYPDPALLADVSEVNALGALLSLGIAPASHAPLLEHLKLDANGQALPPRTRKGARPIYDRESGTGKFHAQQMMLRAFMNRIRDSTDLHELAKQQLLRAIDAERPDERQRRANDIGNKIHVLEQAAAKFLEALTGHIDPVGIPRAPGLELWRALEAVLARADRDAAKKAGVQLDERRAPEWVSDTLTEARKYAGRVRWLANMAKNSFPQGSAAKAGAPPDIDLDAMLFAMFENWPNAVAIYKSNKSGKDSFARFVLHVACGDPSDLSIEEADDRERAVAALVARMHRTGRG